ncbi:flocculation protein FLO11 [Drosophila ficusphila]|uniref:flocculation protein FLO11 n=1 Tax=Drosophila ficusphila TaxID=30025 RepID=UPI0007E6A1F2|nr:flocculation protein FLO11 [Drosophila ficusphila]XP_017049608.1 flocculation protein FLO11 [Drosophila ficusphila]XP_017049609.1 flocculation protein FLO11 [Drosophila ficusphila]
MSRSASTSTSLLLGRSIFFFVTICGCCFAQDSSSYYFPSQNRFVPSSGSFPRQQPQSLSGFRASSGGFSPSPGSYQEQLLFIANENAKQSPPASSSQFGSPFGGSSQFAKPNRQTDYYDISPRPFGVPAAAGGAGGVAAGSGATSASLTNGFTRAKAIRSGSASGSGSGSGSGNSLSGGFQPQTQRINVPHQQTQFLAHFSENGNEKRPSSSSRPFGNGGFSPSRTRTQAPVSALPENPATPAVTPFRPRNRYQPGSSTASTTTTTTGSAEVSSKRFNRYGSNRAKSTSTSTTSTTQNTPADRPSFGRKSPNPRRPVFISREVNEPVSVVSKRPFNYSAARLKLPARPTARTTSTTESAEEEEEEQEDEEQDEQYEEESDEGTEESSSLEKLPLQEESVTPVTVEKDEASSPVEPSELTTVSEVDHESSTSSTEESQTDVSEVTNEEVEVTTLEPAHEEELLEEATTVVPLENQSTEELHVEEQIVTTEEPVESTSKQAEIEKEREEEVPPKPEENASQQEEPKSSKQEEHSTSKSEDHSEKKPEDHSESQYDDEGEGEDYEYDDEEGGEDSTSEVESQDSKPSTPSGEHEEDREIISVVTTKSVVNGSTVLPAPVTPSSNLITEEEENDEEDIASHADLKLETTTAINAEEEKGGNATENYVVVASIQPSRSINGARFLPFPAIEQEETKQTLSELERKVHSKQQQTPPQKQPEGSEEVSAPSSSSSSSSVQPPVAASTESIIDKLDRVQSELSSGLLSGKYPIISQMDSSTPATSTTVGTGPGKFVPHIRKYQPRTTSAPRTTSSGTSSKLKVQHFDETEMDELATLLPVGFKPRPSYKNRKITTTTSTTEAPPAAEVAKAKPGRNSTISRSFKSGQVTVQDVALAGLLPKGYKPPKTTTTTSTTTSKPEESSPNPSAGLESLFSQIQFDDKLASLLPKDYKLSSTPRPENTTTTANPSTTQRNLPVAVPFDDLSTFQLPPGYKAPKEEKQQKEEAKEEPKLPPGVTAIKLDELKNLLPPGFKLNETESEGSDEIPASLLPPGYKAKKVHPASTTSTTTTTAKPKVASPPSTTEAAVTESSGGSGLKVVFPKGFHKRVGSHRLTTPHPSADGGGATESGNSPLQVMIKKGPPTRATTEFTGWPTPPTTPLSIDKLSAQTINFEDLLTASGTSSTTSTTTSTTSTTTTTTPRPTKPGHCTADCDLAATIKIIDGVAWKPELLDHNTLEWKNLAHELEAQLNEVYSGAPQLNKWYKKVRIDSFSKGSVLVDYYVELANITEDVDTLEIKQLFHDALTKPATLVLPDKDAQENETDSVSGPQEEQLVTASYQMGKYIIDPVATDFSVIAKNVHTNVEFAEEDLLIPQWAIVVIVIGVGSLVFVVIFGVTVLLNRQKRAKKTPIPLTNDMLNELKVNHMGRADNYGVDDFYNIDDPWNDTKQPIKPKRFTNSMHGSNSSNIYDSWRSTRHPHSSGDYFYDQQPTYSQKGDSLKRPQLHHGSHGGGGHSQYPSHHHQGSQQQQQHSQQGYGHQYPDAFADAHQMYSYNNHASRTRYSRDYDPDF